MPTNGISGSIAHCSRCHRRVARFPQLGQHFDLQVWKRLLNGPPLRGHYKEFGAISGSRSNSPLRRVGWSSTLFRHVVCLSWAARTMDMEVLQRPHMRRVYRVSCASVRFPLAPDRRQPICRIFGLCQSLQLAFVSTCQRSAILRAWAAMDADSQRREWFPCSSAAPAAVSVLQPASVISASAFSATTAAPRIRKPMCAPCSPVTSLSASSPPMAAQYRPWISISIVRLAHVCPSTARRPCAGYWPTWEPCPKR
jgi:hypothetical protein